jgi:hypothetical protein
MSNDTKIECAKVRKCGWKGTRGDLNEVPDVKESKAFGLNISKHVCPKCGHNEYYELD